MALVARRDIELEGNYRERPAIDNRASQTTPVPGPATAAGAMRPPVFVVVFGALYGTNVAAAKVGAGLGISPIALAFWQMLLAGLLLLGLALILGQTPSLSSRHLRYYAIAGAVGNAVPTVLVFSCADHVGAGVTGLFYPLSPVLTYFFGVLLGQAEVVWARVVGIALGLVGAAFLVAPGVVGAGDVTGSLPMQWLLAALAIPIFLAAGNLYRSADWPPETGSLPLAAGMLLATALMLAPVMLVTDSFYLPVTVDAWPVAALALVSFVAYVVYFELQRIAGAVYFSQVSYSIALTTVLYGLLVFDERPPWWSWVGGLLILVGLFAVTRASSRPGASSPPVASRDGE